MLNPKKKPGFNRSNLKKPKKALIYSQPNKYELFVVLIPRNMDCKCVNLLINDHL